MALENYYKLKEKKKKIILEAIYTCLCNKNYDEISVNDISTESEISRGSFYNYFEDKHDAVSTYIDSKVREYFQKFKDAIIAENGSIIEGAKHIYYDNKKELQNEFNRTVVKNFKFFVEFGMQSVKSNNFLNDTVEMINWLISNSKEGKNGFNTQKKMANLFDLLVSLVLTTLCSQVMFNSSFFKKYDDFDFKINLIKKCIE